MRINIAKKVSETITLTKTINVDITGAILLSSKEAETLMTQEQRDISRWWWLRSPGYSQGYAAYVFYDGSVSYGGCSVDDECVAVRPALNFKSSNLKTGSQFEIDGKSFTVLSDNFAICDGTIGECAFQKSYSVEDANNYEVSDVKKFVDDWFDELKETYEDES